MRGLPEPLRGGPLGRALGQDLDGRADVELILEEGALLLGFDEEPDAPGLLLLAHGLGPARRAGPGTRRILEDESALISDSLHRRARGLEIRLGLAPESHDD